MRLRVHRYTGSSDRDDWRNRPAGVNAEVPAGHRANIRTWLVAAFAAFVSSAPAAPLAIGDALAKDGIYSMRLSPDAKHLVARAHVGGGGLAVVLIDVDTMAPRFLVAPRDDVYGARGAFWVNDSLVAINNPGVGYTIDIRNQHTRSLGGFFLFKVKPDANGHDRVLVRREGDTKHIDRVDVETGEHTPMNFDMPGEPQTWIMDRDGVPRVVSTLDDSRWSDSASITHWYRNSLEAKWEKLATFPVTQVDWEPAFIMADGKSLAVNSSAGRNTAAIFRYNIAERRIEDMLAGHPTQDIRAFWRETDEDDFKYAVTVGMRPEIHWFEPKEAELQRAIDAALPNRINRFAGELDKAVLIYSYGDVDPGRWFILDMRTKSLKPVGARLPQLNPDGMSATRIVSYRSMDGLEIPAYLTRPVGAAQPGPAILLIHGGPVYRDEWGWNPEVQMLASRGYTVLQPQFRGSSGFGNSFRQAGYGQWGLAMQDDVTAGAKWLVEQGYADVDRICIYGGSYGGYAAMWALVKTPRVFKCAISMAGVSDLAGMLSGDSDINEHASSRNVFKLWLGDPKQQTFDMVSPLKNTSAIEAPLLIAHGDRDARVPIGQSRDMVDALRKTKKDYIWLELAGEGHGIYFERNQKLFYETAFDFLDHNIGEVAARRRSADQGHAAAQTQMGISYLKGENAIQDYAVAREWFGKAATNGDATAMFYLGGMSRDGLGVARNLDDAARLFQRASDLGSNEATADLASAYREGQGVVQDFGRALALYRKAATAGDPGAMYFLARMYAQGQGVSADKAIAFIYMRIASTSGDHYFAAVTEAEDLGQALDAETRSIANKVAINWRPGNKLPAADSSN
jgi:dipeptidyl aminopeptidase/acylaminoacyl peptidase